MKKIIFLMAVCALSAVPAWADGVFGTWAFPEQNLGFLTLDMTMVVNSNSLTIASTCKYSDGVNTNAQVSSAATVTVTSIQALQSNSSNNTNDPNHSCQVSIAAGEMDYSISGNTLTLNYQGQSMNLTRTQ
jgi:alpha-L-arabinofuranosidase